MQYFDRIDGGMFRYDVDDIEFNVGEPRVNLFAEYRNQRGTTYRFDAGALTNGAQCRRRTRFVRSHDGKHSRGNRVPLHDHGHRTKPASQRHFLT